MIPKILIARYSTPQTFMDEYNEAAKEVGVDIDYAMWEEIVVDTKAKDLKELLKVKGKPLGNYDLVYVRTVQDKYYELTQLVNVATALGIRVVDKNLSHGSRVGDLKIHQITQAAINGIPVPRTIYATDTTLLDKSDEFNSWPLVLKVMGFHRGQGVMLVENKKEIRAKMDSFLQTKESKNFLLQEVIDYVADYRIFVIGERVVGGIQRIPQKGEFRANIARGGTAKEIKEIPDKLRDLALKACRVMELDISGVDFMEDKNGNYLLTEVNRAPQYEGLMQATGIDIRVEIIKYLKELVTNA